MLAFVLLAVLSDPAAFVRSFYEQDQRGVPDPVYQVRTRAAIRQWFDGPIVDLIWRDLVDAQGEVGRMDGHYLYDAQDNEYAKLDIRTLEQKGDQARVLATIDYGRERRTAEFHLNGTPNGWRIANIVYADTNYIEILEADFPLPKIEDERSEKAVCELYENYEVEVPEGWDPEQEAIQLAELFANGDEDVAQDFSAAIHFICRPNSMAPAERWSMLEHVLLMERGYTKEPLDYCRFDTSRDGGIICASRRDGEETPQLEGRFAAVREQYPVKTLDALRERATAFVDADTFWEVEQYREGTMYAYAETHARLEREKTFIELLELYTKERATPASEADLKRADAKLNAAYRKRMAAIEPCNSEYQNCEPPLEPENLRGAQRAWIPYRDAWIAFYQERWRGAASPDALRREVAAALTRLRTEDFGNL